MKDWQKWLMGIAALAGTGYGIYRLVAGAKEIPPEKRTELKVDVSFEGEQG